MWLISIGLSTNNGGDGAWVVCPTGANGQIKRPRVSTTKYVYFFKGMRRPYCYYGHFQLHGHLLAFGSVRLKGIVLIQSSINSKHQDYHVKCPKQKLRSCKSYMVKSQSDQRGGREWLLGEGLPQPNNYWGVNM